MIAFIVRVSLSGSRSFCKTSMLTRSSGIMRTVSLRARGRSFGMAIDTVSNGSPSALLRIWKLSESIPFWVGVTVIVMSCVAPGFSVNAVCESMRLWSEND